MSESAAVVQDPAPPEAPAEENPEPRSDSRVIDRRRFNAYRDHDEDPRSPRRPSEREEREQRKEAADRRRLIKKIRRYLRDEEFVEDCEAAGIEVDEILEELHQMDLDDLKELKEDIMDAILDSDFAKPISSAVAMFAPKVEVMTTTHPMIRQYANLKGLQKVLKEDVKIKRMLKLADIEVSGYFDPGPVIGSIMAIGNAVYELNASNMEHDVIKAYVKDYSTLRPVDFHNIELGILKSARRKKYTDEALEAAVQKEATVKLKLIQAELKMEEEALKLGVPATSAHLLVNEEHMKKLKNVFNKKRIAAGQAPDFPEAIPPKPEEEEMKTPAVVVPGYVDWRTAGPPPPQPGPSLSAPPVVDVLLPVSRSEATLPGLQPISSLISHNITGVTLPTLGHPPTVNVTVH